MAICVPNTYLSGMKMRSYPNGPAHSEPAKATLPPSKEERAKRKERQAQEGVSAMAEYERKQRALLERTARLRAERIAREAKNDHGAA